MEEGCRRLGWGEEWGTTGTTVMHSTASFLPAEPRDDLILRKNSCLDHLIVTFIPDADVIITGTYIPLS